MAMDECFRSPFFMLKHPSPFMDRVVVPVTVGLAASLHLWLRFLVFEKGPELVVNSLVRAGHHWLWGSWSSDIHLDIDWFTILNCSTCLILYFSRHELLDLGRALVGALRLILRVVGGLIQVLSGWLSYFHRWLDGSHIVAQASTQTAERDRTLTWSVMAVVGAGGPVLPPGSFALISRPPEWDEVIVLAYADGGQVGICKTTSTDGVDWIWTLVNMVGMFIRLPLIQADGVASGPSWSGAWRCELDLHSTGRGSNVGPISGRGGKRNSRGQSDFAAVSGGCDWLGGQSAGSGWCAGPSYTGGGWSHW